MEDQEFINIIRHRQNVIRQICQFYQTNVDRHSRLALPRTPAYDIIVPTIGHIKVIEDRLAAVTNMYAFTMQDRNHRATGVAASTAKEVVLIDTINVIRMATSSLLFLIRDCDIKRIIPMGGTDKEGNRGWGYVLPVETILSSPYIERMDRWF